MGKLVNGKWIDDSIINSDEEGSYNRLPRTFLNTISDKNKVFKPDSKRYHLYVSYACPWATRTLIYRKLKQLENHISFSVVHPDMLANGWNFDQTFLGSTKDHLYNFNYLRDIYLKADPKITTSVTVPVLWDKKTKTIVNNESSQIIRILNSAFNGLTNNHDDYYPVEKRRKIDQLNKQIYNNINNGVYKCGFAITQKTYERAVTGLFKTLDKLEKILKNSKYLFGEKIYETDLRLIPTLLRFDLVYYSHFKCNIKRIIDYQNLYRYMQDMLKIRAIKETFKLRHIKRHYYYSHKELNPFRIIPKGPYNF
tara:strand:- start:266 stop:1195 length:930 start_codon:yes stop_codon:yes gene_type:complete